MPDQQAPETTPPNQQNKWQRQVEKGRILMQWVFDEYEKPERGPWWYILAFVIGGSLLFYAVKGGNFLFALIILLFALIIFTHHRTEPLKLSFSIYETGIQIGDRFFLFREIESFAIIYEPPVVKRIYIKPKGALLRREVSIPLYDQNPLEVRSLLVDFLEEDLEREEESANDVATRILKL